MTEKEFWERCGVDLNHKWVNEIGGYQLRGTICLKCHADGGLFGNDDDTCMPELTLDNLFKYAVPISKMDTLWIINNLDSPSPEIKFCFGFKRDDLICWSRSIDKEDCLSSIEKTPELAVYNAIVKVFEHEEENGI